MDFPSVLSPDSPQARAVVQLLWVILGISAFIFLTVTTLVAINVVRFRRRKGVEQAPAQVTGNTRLEVLWTVIPFGILAVLFGLTVVTMHEIQPPVRGREPDLEVIAHQWWWEGHYPRTGVTVANEFHLPAGQTLLLSFRSADVLHDWWVPELGRKMDIFPNRITYLWMRAERPGTYLGTCDEFCGAEHAWMRIRVIVQTPGDYEAWTREQLAAPPAPAMPDARQGAALFAAHTCASCHTVAGLSTGSVGPDLSHVGSRETLGAGIIENRLGEMTRWVYDAQLVKPHCHMPNLDLSEAESHQIAVFLEGLR